jgi:REP element-mobilizing transposase RayT
MRRQLSFFRKLGCEPARTEHGGEIRLGRRKLSRPIDTRRPMHVVLRSSRAHGAWSLRRRECERIVLSSLRRSARRYGIRLYEFANSGNHLHLLLRTKCRLALQNFLRVFAGVTARLITGARRGWAVGKFWDFLSYSRIVAWGRDFRGVRAYVVQNRFEAMQLIAYRPRLRRRRTTDVEPARSPPASSGHAKRRRELRTGPPSP